MLDPLVQVVGCLLQRIEGLVLSCQDLEELVFAGVQQVLRDGTDLFGLFHGAEGPGHRGVALLRSPKGLVVELLHLLVLICEEEHNFMVQADKMGRRGRHTELDLEVFLPENPEVR